MNYGYARPLAGVKTQRAVAGAIAAAMVGMSAAPATIAVAASSKTYVLSKKVETVNGRKVTITVFTRDGKKYRAKEWFTGTGAKKVKHRYVYLMKGKGKAATATPTAATKRACTEAEQGAVQSAYEVFLKHLKAGHLDTSPEGQVKDILDADQYTLTHTVLVENMLAQSTTDAGSLPAAASALIDVFMKHLNAGHLETSPEGQVKDIGDTDQYVLTHTVLVENMMAPILEWEKTFAAGKDPVCTEQASAPASGAPAAPAPAASDVAIAIKDLKFPAVTAVGVGSKVTWTNEDDAPHTVTSMHGSELKSGNFTKGQTFSYTFTKAGTYMYVCDVHPNMKGEIDVK